MRKRNTLISLANQLDLEKNCTNVLLKKNLGLAELDINKNIKNSIIISLFWGSMSWILIKKTYLEYLHLFIPSQVHDTNPIAN
jgi:hypothetical protein